MFGDFFSCSLSRCDGAIAFMIGIFFAQCLGIYLCFSVPPLANCILKTADRFPPFHPLEVLFDQIVHNDEPSTVPGAFEEELRIS